VCLCCVFVLVVVDFGGMMMSVGKREGGGGRTVCVCVCVHISTHTHTCPHTLPLITYLRHHPVEEAFGVGHVQGEVGEELVEAGEALAELLARDDLIDWGFGRLVICMYVCVCGGVWVNVCV
jgi:hypothetical protein